LPTLDKETQQLINSARTLGSRGIAVYLTDEQLIRLCLVIGNDLKRTDLVSPHLNKDELNPGYYGLPFSWFSMPVEKVSSFEELFLKFRSQIDDFATYFKCLCEIHKRRLKYEAILESQPFSKMEQIVPRSLLEFGLRPSETLASWLVWRKWLYDIDNRSAQETGYLFEPILAAAIGGVPFSPQKSPVKRADDPKKGRQVDCLNGKLAYEFKMRVTIAASGQGRFKEELDFARDCHASGFVPVLLVLDPTPSTRLDELAREYNLYEGKAYIGANAWSHVEQQAGEVMGTFVENYLRIPLQEVDSSYTELKPLKLDISPRASSVLIGDEPFSISRATEDFSLEESDENSSL